MTTHDALVDGVVEHLEMPSATSKPTVVVGAPGSGRTSVLAALASRWPGTVWTTVGATQPAKADLTSLVRRWSADLGALDVSQRRTLLEVQDLPRNTPVDEDLITSLATVMVNLAGRTGGAHPVLWSVDDLDRTDALTRATVERLTRCDDAIQLIATAEIAPPSWRATQLPPLSDHDVRRLLIDRRPLAPRVATALADVAEGNPFVALGLMAGLNRDQCDGTDELPDPLPLGDELQHRSGELMSELGAAETAVLAAVVVRARVQNDPWVSVTSLGGEAVDVAHRSGLLDVDGDRVAVTPRWLHSAIATTIPPRVLAEAHRDAAIEATGDEALRHRALATDGVDHALARDLAAAAERRMATAELAHASVLMEHAHAVAPPLRRPDLARSIATSALMLGRPATAQRWSAIADHDEGSRREPINHTAIYASSSTEPDPEVRRQHLRSIVTTAAHAPISRRAPLAVQLVVWGQTFALPGILEDVEAAESLLAGAEDRDARVIQMTAAIARRLVDADPASRTTLEALTGRVCQLLAASPRGPDIADAASAPSVAAQWLGIVAMSDERWDDAESLLVAAEQLEASRGWSGMRAATLGWLAELRWRQGRWSDAEALVRLADVDHAGSSAARAVRDAVLERAAAIRSVEPPSIATDDRVPGGLGDLLRHHGLALAALGANRPDVAVVHLRRAEKLADGALDHPGLVWWQGDLVEALAASGDVRAADDALVRLERRSARLDTPLSRAHLLRARAARQQGRTAVRLLVGALSSLEETPVPFEVARTRLALAEALSNDGEADAAAEHADAAHGAFASLGAAGFAQRTQALLDDVPEVPLWSALTERGREITRRVTRGETNRQIASALGLSEKTVEFHLGKVFRTLRVSSRAELAGRFGALGTSLVDFRPERQEP